MSSGEVVVHIIESPKPHELLVGHHDGLALQEALKILGIPAKRWLVVNRAMLDQALTSILDVHTNERPGDVPFLHLSLHSGVAGIGLSNGESISWSELAPKIATINYVAQNMLFVSMSSCHGYEGATMAFTEQALPYRVLIGPKTTITWQQGFVAFTVMYHHLQSVAGSFESPEKLCEVMAVASGTPAGTFGLVHGPQVQEKYIEGQDEMRRLLEEGDTSEIVRRLISKYTGKARGSA